MSVPATPVVAWAVAAVAAGWVGWWVRPSIMASTVLFVIALAAARRSSRLGRTLAGAAAVFCVVAGLTTLHLDGLSRGPLVELAEAGGTRVLTGVIVADARPTDTGWWTLVRVESVGGRRDRQRAYWHGTGPPPPLGATVQVASSARPLDPGGFGDWLRTRHAAVELNPGPWELVERPGWLHGSTNWVRAQVRALAGDALADAPAGLAVGLVTGDVSLLPADDVTSMNATGLSHLTAVSGSNVAIVLAGALLLGRTLGLRGTFRRVLVLATMSWFAILTRLEPSVLRASAMVALVLLAQFRGERTEPVHAVATATLLLVLVDPLLARSLGLLLSVSATLGLLVVAPRIARRFRWLPRGVRVLLATSLGAQLAVAPVLLATTGDVPLVSIVANMVAVPAAAAASTLALVGALVGLAAPGLGRVCFSVAAIPLEIVLHVARALVGRGPEVTGGLSAAAVLGMTGWLVARPGSPTARRSLALALVATVVVAAPVPVSRRDGGPALVVTAIDVGQGDAILVEAPGVAMLVDGGDSDAAASWMRRHGPRRLDLVVLSHPHADHVGGLKDVVTAVSVGAIWWRPLPEMTPAAHEFAQAADALGIPMHEPEAGMTLVIGELKLEVLGPPAGRPYVGADSEPNEMSIVLRVSWRGRSALLTGDVEEGGQRDLLSQPSRLAADVLKVPHHGSSTSLPEFLEAVGPTTALVSAGRDNDYGHPNPRTLRTLEQMRTDVRRTDLEGTIQVALEPAGSRLRRDGVLSTGHRSSHARGFVDSSRVRGPDRRRRPTPGGSRTGDGAIRVARRRRHHPRRRSRGHRARAPARAAHPLAVR